MKETYLLLYHCHVLVYSRDDGRLDPVPITTLAPLLSTRDDLCALLPSRFDVPQDLVALGLGYLQGSGNAA